MEREGESVRDGMGRCDRIRSGVGTGRRRMGGSAEKWVTRDRENLFRSETGNGTAGAGTAG